MADNFNASLVISTSDAVNNVRNLDSASKDLDKTLAHLHTTMSANQGDMTKISAALKDFTVAQAQSNKNAGTRQQNLIREARLEREQIVNKGKLAEATQKQAQHDAKLQGIRARNGRDSANGLGNATRRNAESDARIANAGVLATARATTEAERLAAATQRTAAATAQRAAAEARAEGATLRLAQAQERARNSNLALNDSLSNSRYLLFDVGATYTALSIALLAIPAATARVAASYEKDFAQVIRTTGITGAAANQLSEELKQMATQIPLSFGELAGISAIAGQLGIGKKEISEFTETVAKFGAASNVGINDAATAFGRLENSFNPDKNIPDFFNKVGSAVAYVGVRSAATETEIIAVTNQISAAGAQFGFTADQIVGLSGALASVRIRPELARGAFQRIMLSLSRAADEGGESFNKFGKYTGLAGDAAVNLFKNDPSTFFNKYINGIKATIDSGKSVSSVLDDIGAKNVFDKQFILGLANGQKVYNQALEDSSKAFKEGSFLNESTDGIFSTFSATIERLGNAFANLGASMGAGPLKYLTPLADDVLNFTSAAGRLIEQVPGLKLVVGGFMALAAVTGVLLGVKAAQAFVLAGLVGLQQVMGKTSLAGALTLRGGMMEVAKTMLMAKGASAQLATQLLAGRSSMNAFTFATTQTTASLHRFATAGTLAGYAAGQAAAGATRGSAAMRVFSGALSIVGGPIGAVILGLGALGLAFISSAEESKQAGEEIAKAMGKGSDAALVAATDAIGNLKVSAADGAIALGSLDKKLVEVAREAGVPFERLAAAALKGADAGKEVNKVLDDVAVSKGYANAAAVMDDLSPKGLALAAQLGFLREKVKGVGNDSITAAKNAKDLAKGAEAVGASAEGAAPSAENLDVSLDGVGDSAESAATKFGKLVSALFGFVDAEAATQEAMSQLGAGLQESTDFGTGTDGGRANIANFRDTLRAAAQEQAQLAESGQQTFSEASANYTAFIDGLLQELAAKGVNVAQVQELANQAKGIFGSTFASGEQPAITPTVDGSQVAQEAANATNLLQNFFTANRPSFSPGMDTGEAQSKAYALANELVTITGWPYEVVVDALTNPATQKGQELAALLTSITNNTYVAPVGADTSAAITNVRNFANFASSQLAAIQSSFNAVAASSPTLAKYGMGAFKGVTGVKAPAGIARPASAPAQVAAPKQVAPKIATPNFGALDNGYKNAAKAAKGAGDAGKQAGKDMANGIDEATDAANDYASRLKTALTSAFDKQYGMKKAADEYNKALNAITKKREDELAQLDDLIAKQKELNNSRDEDLVAARKAGTEKAISQKYGETDRAMDYAQQEEEALLAAAAKQKDIDANNKTANSLRAGIDDFTSNSDAAIENREALRNLESKMLDMVSAYAATGASQEQVRAYAQRLTGQFKTDVGQVHNNRLELDYLIGDMWRYIGAVNAVPQHKPVRVSADTGAASNALGDFSRGADWATRDRDIRVGWKMTSYTRELPGQVYQGQQVWGVFNEDGSSTGKKFFNRGGLVEGYASGGLIPGKSPSDPRVDNLMASVDGKGMVKVRSGEFIVQQPAVDYWGLDFFKNLNNMKMPAFNGGGSVGGGYGGGSGSSNPLLVELTAENLQAIMRLADRDINLFAGVEKLASSVNEGQKILASKGVS